MATPSSALSTQRPDLATMMEYDLQMSWNGFIGDQIMPVLESGVQSGNFGKIPLNELKQSRDTLRAPGAGYARGEFEFEADTFATQEHGAEEPVDDRESKMYANYFDHELVSTNRAMDAVLTNAEKRIAAAVVANAVTGPTISTPWSTYASATPINDVDAGMRLFRAATGLVPDALVMEWIIFRELRLCTQIIDRVKYQGFQDVRASELMPDAIAAVLGIDKLIVAGAENQYNTAAQGASAASLSPIWSETDAYLLKTSSSPDIKDPSFGRTIHWSEDGSQIGGLVETYRDEVVRSEIVRVRHDVDEKVLYADMCMLMEDAAA